MRSKVLLPAPLEPSNTVVSLLLMLKLMSFSTRWFPKDLFRLCTAMPIAGIYLNAEFMAELLSIEVDKIKKKMNKYSFRLVKNIHNRTISHYY